MNTTKYKKKDDEAVQAETPVTTYQTYNSNVKNSEPQQVQQQKIAKTNIPNVVPNSQAADYSMGQQAAAKSFSYNGTKPTYASPYSQQIDQLFNEIQSAPAFEYDPYSDEAYQALRGQYTNLGQRAMKDTTAQIAAQTGGLASSYAASAGAQAYNNYMSELAGYVPELQQLAYEMYQNDLNKKYQQLDSLNTMENNAYNRYLNELNDYYTEYGNAYNKYLNEQEQQNYLNEFAYQQYLNNLEQQNWETQFDYQKEQDALTQKRYEDEFEYQKYLNELEQENYQNEFDYQKEQNDLDRAWEEALTRAQFGDYSGLTSLGIDMSNYGTVTEDDEYNDIDEYSDSFLGQLAQGYITDITYRDSDTLNSFTQSLEEAQAKADKDLLDGTLNIVQYNKIMQYLKNYFEEYRE